MLIFATGDNHRVITAAASASAPAASSIGPGVIVAIVFIAVWAHALFRHGKGTVQGRLLAVVIAMVVGWVLLAVTDLTVAAQLATGTASGVATDLHAIATLIHH